MILEAEYAGVRFGGYSDRVITEFDPGEAELVTVDAQVPMGDGVLVGRDFLGGRTWGFTVTTNVDDVAGAREALSPLARAWRDPSVRLTPGAVVPLSYRVGDEWRRVYGRPGRWADMDLGVASMQGAGAVVMDFRVTDPRYFADTAKSVDLTIIPESTGGLIAPLVAPLMTAAKGGQRAGLVTNAGDTETPLVVTFHGPCRDPKIVAEAGWEVGLVGSLAYDQSVTVDGLTKTVTRSDGAQVPGMLTRSTQISRMVMPPGLSDVTFSCIDDTGTAKAVLSWRDAYTSI